MNKKDLKLYEIPTCEVMEVDVHSALLAGSAQTGPGKTPDESDMEDWS